MIQVEIKDKVKFFAAFLKLPEMVSREIRKEMKASLAEIVEEAGQNHTYKTNTGRLEKDDNYDIIISNSGFTGAIKLNERLPYSHIQHEGGTIKADKIKPIPPTKSLKFNIGNIIYYRRRIYKDIVIKATKFLENAATRMERVVLTNMDLAVDRAIAKAGF